MNMMHVFTPPHPLSLSSTHSLSHSIRRSLRVFVFCCVFILNNKIKEKDIAWPDQAPVVVHRMRTIYSCKYKQILVRFFSFCLSFFWQLFSSQLRFLLSAHEFWMLLLLLLLLYVCFETYLFSFHIWTNFMIWHKILSTNNTQRTTFHTHTHSDTMTIRRGYFHHIHTHIVLPSVRRDTKHIHTATWPNFK